MSGEILVGILSVTATLLVVFLTPLGDYFVTRRFLGAPMFSLSSHKIDSDLRLRLIAQNRKARRNRPLGIEIDGVTIFPATTEPPSHNFTWTVDLKDDRIKEILERVGSSREFNFRVFQTLGEYSDTYRVFLPENFRKIITPPPEILRITVKSAIEMMENFVSNRQISADFQRAYVPFAPQLDNHHAIWSEVHDGMELGIRDVENFSLQGVVGTELVSKASYAWVLAFVGCRSVKLSTVTFGHETEGTCTGGVLKFTACQGVVINNSHLFGCGTNAFELVSVISFEFSNVEMYNCTNGLGIISQGTRVSFRNCLFRDSGRFNFLTVSELVDDIIFYECEFRSNDAIAGWFVQFDSISSSRRGKVRFINCNFLDNLFPNMSNIPECLAFHDCTFDSKFEATLRSRNPRPT